MSIEREIDLSEVLSQEDVAKTSNAEQTQEQHASSQIPNGIGLTIEAVQALICQQNNVFFPKDDPTMGIVTILNAFLGENQKLQNTYMQALRQLFSDLTQGVNLEIQQTTQEVQSSLRTISITGLTLIHKEQTKEIERLRQHLFYACTFIAVSTTCNIIALIWS